MRRSRAFGGKLLAIISLLGIAFVATGCHCGGGSAQSRALIQSAGLTEPHLVPTVRALCDPPIHWAAEPLKSSPNHTHQVWLSPSKATAYGVIHFGLPWPVGDALALRGFINQMRQTEGRAVLLSQASDPNLPGVRFVVEGGLYKIRANLIVDGFDGWAIYAGTRRDGPELPDELDLAERARDRTSVGRNAYPDR